MRRFTVRTLPAALVLVALAATGVAGEKKEEGDGAAKSRSFRLDYGATLEEVPEGARVRVWLPVPQSNEHQKIEALEPALPAKPKTAVEPTYGNEILSFETKGPASGSLAFKTSYRVRRREVRGLSDQAARRSSPTRSENVFSRPIRRSRFGASNSVCSTA